MSDTELSGLAPYYDVPPKLAPESVPAWATAGRFRFARWDGGPVETAKAILSGWDYMFHPDSIQACSDWYGQQSIDLLEQARINWIWVTWSVGFSHQAEQQQRELLKPFIARCHARGIHVTAYMSMANMFWESMFQDEPRSKDWLQVDEDGNPVPYGAAELIYKVGTRRYLACLNHPQWQAYLLQRVDCALDAGADGLFYDNMFTECRCPRCQDAFATFCQETLGKEYAIPRGAVVWGKETPPGMSAEETKRLRQTWFLYRNQVYEHIHHLVAERAHTRRPQTLVYGNCNTGYDTFAFPSNNAIFTEDGREPGLAEGKLVCNAGLLRALRAASRGWRPVTLEHGLGRGPNTMSRYTPMTPRKHKIALAECAMHQAACAITPEGHFLNHLFFRQPEGMENWQAISDYNRFLEEREEYFADCESAADICVITNDGLAPLEENDHCQRVNLLNALAQAGLFFDVLLAGDMTLEKLRRYRLVILPEVKYLRQDMTDLARRYAEDGGDVISAGATEPEGLISEIRKRASAPVVEIKGPPHVLYTLFRQPQRNRYLLHLLNYADEPIGNLKVVLRGELANCRAQFISPDPGPAASWKPGGELTIPRLDIYGLLVLSQ